MAGSRESSPIAISNDEEQQQAESPPPVAEHELPTADWIVEDELPRPVWLPDGFGMDGFMEDDGTFQPTNFFCPVTGMSFGTKTEVVEYCSSDGMERALQAKKTLDDKNTLQGKYAWLRGDHKWLLEIRLGGENGTKMFKVYSHPYSKVRITSKTEVMRLINEGKLPDESANDGDNNDMSKRDNIIAQLDFNVPSLPPGWVKEIAFRKSSDGGIRTDRFYTDPLTKKVFRSLNAAEEQFKYGNKEMDGYNPHMSVTELYSFDGCMDMPPWLAKRRKIDGTDEECQTSTLLHHGLTAVLENSNSHDVDGEEIPSGDGMEDGKRFRSITELLSLQNEKGNVKRKGKKKE